MADQFVVYPPTTSISTIAQLPVALGQTTMANSLAVVIASNQSAIPVSQSGTWNITNISGTISLPTGAATEATLAAASAKLPATLGQKLMAASMAVALASDQSAIPVTGTFFQATQPVSGTFFQATQPVSGTVAATQSGTWNITDISGTISLPTGAATEATLAAQSAKLPAALGQTTMSGSVSFTLASDQSALPASAGLSKADFAINTNSSTNITSAAYVQLIASTAAAAKQVYIFEGFGTSMKLAFGGAGAEVDQIYVDPGGPGLIPLAVPAGTRVSVKSVATTANTGEFIINLLG